MAPLYGTYTIFLNHINALEIKMKS
jgi:hypothetical protein